jgi:hypothetical protein
MKRMHIHAELAEMTVCFNAAQLREMRASGEKSTEEANERH